MASRGFVQLNKRVKYWKHSRNTQRLSTGSNQPKQGWKTDSATKMCAKLPDPALDMPRQRINVGRCSHGTALKHQSCIHELWMFSSTESSRRAQLEDAPASLNGDISVLDNLGVPPESEQSLS